MKSLIITVAGTATRFNRDTTEDTLKCLYHIGNESNCLLSQLIDRAKDYDEIILVGGYLYDRLESYVNSLPAEIRCKIKLVYNPHYQDYGSGYSLLLGIEATNPESTEILFVEGDLYVDYDTFRRIVNSDCNVITVNHELIYANKAVVLYIDTDNHVHYVYDTKHNSLRIPTDFTAVLNSGQTWKFVDCQRLRDVVASLTPVQQQGTNLEIIQGYFGELDQSQYIIVPFDIWHNCNTVSDYNKVYNIIVR